jgi:hypothetical protein
VHDEILPEIYEHLTQRRKDAEKPTIFAALRAEKKISNSFFEFRHAAPQALEFLCVFASLR